MNAVTENFPLVFTDCRRGKVRDLDLTTKVRAENCAYSSPAVVCSGFSTALPFDEIVNVGRHRGGKRAYPC